MMKSMKSMVLAECLAAASFSAQAGVLDKNFVGVNPSGTPIVFNLHEAFTVEKIAGAVVVTAANLTQYSYADPTGALYTKILNSPDFARTFYPVSGTLIHVNVQKPLYIQCYQNKTTMTYNATGYTLQYADNCATFNGMYSASQ
jgi:hypothetical protein